MPLLFLDRLIWGLATIIFAGVLFGCASPLGRDNRVWFKPGGTIEERDRLLAAAQVQATQAQNGSTPSSPDSPGSGSRNERHVILTTMTATGWRLIPKSEAGTLRHASDTRPPARSLSTALDR